MRRHVMALKLLILTLTMGWTSPSHALELRAGRSWFEQGDFLLAPGVEVAVVNDQKQSLRIEFTGRTFGGFTEATGIISLNFPYEVLPWKSVYTTYGVSLMDEYTAYDSPHGKDESIHAMNLGINLSIGWKVIEAAHWNASLEWNSHLFAAGVAFIYLTTARKTNFSACVGYEI